MTTKQLKTINTINSYFARKQGEASAEELINFMFPDLRICGYIRKYFNVTNVTERPIYFFTAGELCQFFNERLGVEVSPNKIGRILTAEGVEAVAKSIGGQYKRGYYVDPLNNVDLIQLTNIKK